MSLFKYVSAENACRAINGNVRFTQPSAFNDPFELLPEIYFPNEIGKIDLKISFDLAAKKRGDNTLNLDDNFIHEQCNDDVSRKILAELNQKIGIFCLSKNDASLLMWAHYANQYSGAMIEFDDKHNFFENIFDIEYREFRPKKSIKYYIDAGTPIPVSELCIKPQEWSYENECRLIRPLAECTKIKTKGGKLPIYVLDIPIESIKSVTIGERMSVEDQRKIWNKVKDTKVMLYLAAISDEGFSFRKDIIKNDVPVNELNPYINPRTAHIFSNLNNNLGDLARMLIDKHPLSEKVNRTA